MVTGSAASGCVAVSRLLSCSLLLLEDGQVVSLDEFSSAEGWVAEAFRELNHMRLPVIDVAIGGVDVAPAAVAVPRSGAAGRAGQRHFIAVTAAGEVWVFGHNDCGQLGLGHTRDVLLPTRLGKFAPEAAAAPLSNIKVASRTAVPARIVAVAAGRAHSLALTADGAIYAWGSNREGQSGLALPDASSGGETRGRTHSPLNLSMHVSPRFVHHLSHTRVASIAACNHVSAAVGADGTVWQWGYGLAKGQVNVPERVAFEEEGAESPAIVSVALGHAHALLLDQQGRAYSLGLGLTGALGHDFPSGLAHAPRLASARRITVTLAPAEGEGTFVQVYAGAFSSALLDSEGRVFVCGSNASNKLGLSVEQAQEQAHVSSPQLVRSLLPKIASSLAMGAERTLVFVPTSLSSVEPRVVQIQGGTALTLSGAGFFPRRDAAAGPSADASPANLSQILVSFSYLGAQVRVPASYDALSDTLRVPSPDLRGSGQAGKGGSYRNGALENCVVRASMDGGQHFSNALSLHVFAAPSFSATGGKGDRTAAAAVAAEVVPAYGPVQGGSALQLRARFDAVPYQHILVRFRVKTSSGDDQAGAVIGTVPGWFDPAQSCIRCTTPAVDPSIVPASVASSDQAAAAAGASRPSRFARAAPAPTPSTHVQSGVEVSLDGQNFFTFGAGYAFYAVSASQINPGTIGVAGGSELELAARGVHYSSPAQGGVSLRFAVGNFKFVEVPARFVGLVEHRAVARALREREARASRKARREEAEALRVRQAQLALEEEEGRDPREKEKLAREKERAEKEREKERARAEKAAEKEREKAAAAASRPGSASGEAPGSRPRSSAGGRGARPSSRGSSTPHRDNSSRPGTAEKPPSALADPASASAAAAASAAGAENTAAATATTSPTQEFPTEPEEKDEWDLLEERLSAEEAAQDAALALLSREDREAVGFLCARAPSFGEFGACRPAISVTLNGRDYVPLDAELTVSRPEPLSMRPRCGPVGGGTLVQVEGQHFYYASHIDVQVRPAPPAPAPPAPASASAAAQGKSRPISAGNKQPKSLGAGGAKPKVDVSEPAAVPPPAVQQAQTVPGELVVLPEPHSPALRFLTPSWASGAGVATVHVGFEPSSNAFSSVTSPALRFLYYEPPVVMEAHPLLVSQAGGTEVVLQGRGLVASDSIRVRLVLPEIEEHEHKARSAKTTPATAAALAPPSEAASVAGTPTLSGRRLGGSKGAAAAAAAAAASASVSASAASAAAPEDASPPPRPLAYLDVAGVHHAHDSPEETEEHAKMLAKKKPRAAVGAGAKAAAGAGGVAAAVDADPEQATISFLAPSALAFSPSFADGSAMNRALEVELALNGQQFVPTGIVLRFDKDAKVAKKKVESIKKK